MSNRSIMRQDLTVLMANTICAGLAMATSIFSSLANGEHVISFAIIGILFVLVSGGLAKVMLDKYST